MERGRRNEWKDDDEVYSASQVEGVVGFCGIGIDSDTNTHFLCYCPFHNNTDTPALAVDKHKGLWNCFNPSCMQSGTLLDLLKRTKGLNIFQSMRTIFKYANEQDTPFSDRLDEVMTREPEFVPFEQATLDRLRAGFPGSPGEEYMRSRGFDDKTLDYFGIGYSSLNNMVAVPMHDPSGMPLGIIGRTASHSDKRFKNSTNLPKSKTAWNIHRAKRHGDTVVIVEASFDGMRVHQAGYPNVVALLGGHVTSHHIAQLGRSFSKVIIMTDYDEKIFRPNCRMCGYKKCQGHRPGRDLGRSIAAGMVNKSVYWAAYNDTCVYPNNSKDPGDMTDEQIRTCLRNAISDMEYSMWGIEELVAS